MGHDIRRAAPRLDHPGVAALILLALAAASAPAHAAEPPIGRVICTQGTAIAVGTGFVVSRKGFAVTAAHVARPDGRACDRLEYAASPIDTRPVEVVEFDERRDLALLRIPGAQSNLMTLFTGSTLPPEDDYDIIGFPIAADQRDAERSGYTHPSPSRADLSRLIHDSNHVLLVQVDGNLNPGQSGGPMLDACGRVVGLATHVRRGLDVDGLAWAVHARELHAFLDGRPGLPAETLSLDASPCDPDAPPRWLLLAGLGGLALLVLVWWGLRRPARRPAAEARPAPAAQPAAPSTAPPAAPAVDPVPPTAPVRWTVSFVGGPLIGERVQLLPTGLRLGRDPAFSDLAFPPSTMGISRQHAELRLRDGVPAVRDVGSSGGTRVGGLRIPSEQWISVDAGVTIELGTDVALVLEES